jgi:hypothetical protein
MAREGLRGASRKVGDSIGKFNRRTTGQKKAFLELSGGDFYIPSSIS